MNEPTVAVYTSMISSSSAIIASNAQVDLGLPLPEMLAAFAGASLILSFLPPRADGKLRGILTILFCMLAGAWLGPYAGDKIGIDAKYALGTAFAMAALCQVVIPLFIENRATIFNMIKKRIGLGE